MVTVLLVLALVSGAGKLSAAPAGSIAILYDLAYKVVGAQTLRLDVYEPGDGSTHPAVLLVHGGGWSQGDKSLWVKEGQKLATSGFVAFAVNYRLAPLGGTSHALDPVYDLRDAIKWIRANAATFGVDPARVGALGDSAGGNLVLMLGTTGTTGQDKANAVVSWSGATDLPALSSKPSSKTYIGCTYSKCPSAWVAASPYYQVDSSDSPTYLANSTSEITPQSQATSMADALTNAGVPNQLHLLDGSLHARKYENTVWSESVAFLHQYLDETPQSASPVTTGHRVLSSPAVADGIVYVGAEDRRLHAFDAVVGTQLWTSQTGGIIDSAPAVGNGRVYVSAQDGYLYAFNASTGALAWSATGVSAGFVDATPTVSGSVVYAASNDGALTAFNGTSGAKLWTTKPTNTARTFVQFAPAVANGLVYAGSNDGTLYAFNASTGAKVWSTHGTSKLFFWCPTVDSGTVFVGTVTVFEEGALDAVDASSGSTQWSVKAKDKLNFATCPAIANGLVFASATDGHLYTFQAASGAASWSATTGGAIYSSPTVASGIVYVGSDDHKLYAFDASTGSTLWTAITGDIIHSAPAVSGGLVYVGSADQSVYAFEASTGAPVWRTAIG
jgi:outer membrane protein assembly factor BamB